MSRVRVVATRMPALRALRGKPLAPGIAERLAAALPEDRIELIVEPSEEARLEAIGEAEFYCCENERVSPQLLKRAKRLRLIQAGGVFIERLGTERAAAAGIPVVRFPMPITESVADHAMALLLGLVRNMPEASRRAREGGEAPPSPTRPDGSAYNWTHLRGVRPLRGMRLGILGLGDIGRAFALRAKAFGMETRYWNRTPLPAWINRRLGARAAGREEVLRTADVLFLGVLLGPETRGMIGEAEIAALPEGAILLNIGRGPLVDQKALLRALEEGRLGGAGLDVFEPEPLPTDHPLLKLPNVIPTPHVAGGDDDTLVSEIETFFGNIHRVLAGKRPRGIVNGVKWR